jgi:hypothetical protein
LVVGLLFGLKEFPHIEILAVHGDFLGDLKAEILKLLANALERVSRAITPNRT